MSKKIDIGTVLNELNITVDESTNTVRTFGLRYVKADGSRGEIYNARKNVKSPKQQKTSEEDQRGKSFYNLKYNGVILFFNEDTKETRSIKRAAMTHFRPFGSKDWFQIFH